MYVCRTLGEGKNRIIEEMNFGKRLFNVSLIQKVIQDKTSYCKNLHNLLLEFSRVNTVQE